MDQFLKEQKKKIRLDNDKLFDTISCKRSVTNWNNQKHILLFTLKEKIFLS